MKIKPLIKESYLLRRSYVSEDTQIALDNLAKHCNVAFKDYPFRSGDEFNGWQVPKKWSVVEAKIYCKKKLIYDGLAHPLSVITNSGSFEGKVLKKELLAHLYSAPSQPEAIPFHFRLSYRPWTSDWGFCVPHNLLKSLQGGSFDVVLKTKQSSGEMVSREFEHTGKSDQEIIFVAHVDHPGMANDDLSGCAVGVALMNEIKRKFPKPKFTYKLLLTQEIVGSVFYLNKIGKQKRSRLKYGLFLEMLGNDNSLNLASSFGGNTYIDTVCRYMLKEFDGSKESGFRESAGNDEIVFEAPGYEIPMPSISRWPYAEYHTSLDNLEIIHESRLQESLEYLLGVVDIFEQNVLVKRKFEGLVSLANPNFDLYVDPGQIISGGLGQNKKHSAFQYMMPRFLEGEMSVLEMAIKFDVEFDWLMGYFNKMQEKGLVNLLPAK